MTESTTTLRVTRGRTGKLPTPASRKDFVTEFEDEEGSPPPTPSRKALPNAAKKVAAQEEEPVQAQEALEVVPFKKPGPIFQTFKTNKKLEDGLCVVRAVGGGRYEIVNLDSVSQENFASEETGAVIKADEGRHNMLARLEDKDWNGARFKVVQAIGSAEKSIFRLRKLPLELRMIIYDYAMVGSKPLHHSGSRAPTLGLALMQTSKEILEETRPFFYKNSFHIDGVVRGDTPDYLLAIHENLREVTFTWRGWCRRDVYALRFFQTCPKLKTLNLVVTSWGSVNSNQGGYIPWRYRQHRYQDDASIKKFSIVEGFDEIVSMKGFETVRVLDDGSTYTAAEIATFKDFLTPLLTAAKYVPPPKPERVVKPAKVKKSKKAKRNNWEDDSDYGGK